VVTQHDSQRFHEVDLLKAVGILTVVLIHSLRSPWEPSISPLELWLGNVTRFAVPGFLVASGYLYATTAPIGWALTRRRLRSRSGPWNPGGGFTPMR
jgi:fucose 4-O-acetylase-like acetyltransferase